MTQAKKTVRFTRRTFIAAALICIVIAVTVIALKLEKIHNSRPVAGIGFDGAIQPKTFPQLFSQADVVIKALVIRAGTEHDNNVHEHFIVRPTEIFKGDVNSQELKIQNIKPYWCKEPLAQKEYLFMLANNAKGANTPYYVFDVYCGEEYRKLDRPKLDFLLQQHPKTLP